MRALHMFCLLFAFTLTAPAAWASNSDAYDRVTADAERVRIAAREVKQLLKDRDADLAAVQQHLDVLDTHAQSLKAALESVDATSLTVAQHAALKRARSAADILLVVLANKSAILADAERAGQQRGLLRGKAEAIAKRAEIVGRQVSILRG